MAGISVQVDVFRSDRSLVPSKSMAKGKLVANPVLLFWRHLVDHAVQDAKRTLHGMPTDGAILARWWIAEHKPKRNDKAEWERSFECACSFLEEEAEAYRRVKLGEIDAHLQDAYKRYVQSVIYQRRAMVLACAGYPTTIAKQFQMPLVSKKDFEHVAGIDHGDRYVMYDRRDLPAA